MEVSIQINVNNKDMFNINIPSFDAGTVVPSPPVSQPSELENFTEKSIVSFGTMAICILLFLVFIFIFKRKRKSSETADYYNEEIENKNTNERKEDENNEYKLSQEIKSKTYLNTPSSIHKCIKSFLENTKEN